MKSKKQSKKKTLYWHPLAKEMIAKDLSPKNIKTVFDDIFPQNDITSRKIGGYKRRCVDEGLEIVSDNSLSNIQSMITWAEKNVSADDKWIHQVVINSAMSELRVFAFKTMTKQDEVSELDKFEEWINERVL
jgi:hypothetical protein